jgi:hypothetical protein
VYALYDARTDQFAQLGKPYKTKPGFYLLAGPNWKGGAPTGIEAVIRCATMLANAIPRIFMDDTPEDRKAIQSVINRIVFYPLAKFDGTMKTQNWAQAPAIPGPKSGGGGETKWVVPEKFFDQFGTVLDTVAPLPGEIVIAKRTCSAFIGTDLESQLHGAGQQVLVVTGVITNNSVEATVRMAGNLGFETLLVEDATFTFGRTDWNGIFRTAAEVHAMSLANLDGEYCKVVRTRDVLD